MGSLAEADYTNAKEFFSDGINLVVNLEAKSKKRLVDFVVNFRWLHGSKTVKMRLLKGGLVRAVSEAWYPSSMFEYGLLLEDDLEVSPVYMDWINHAMTVYTRMSSNRLIGISLYSPRVTETTNPPRPFYSNNVTFHLNGNLQCPYFMQTPCSWGAVYFPSAWREFLHYMRMRLRYEDNENPEKNEYVTIPSSRTNGWQQSWKKYLFELMYLKGSYLLCPNFGEQKSFSTNHMEQGEHITSTSIQKKKDYAVPLWQANEVSNLQSVLHMYDPNNIPILNIFGDPWSSDEAMIRELREIRLKWENHDLTALSPGG